MKRMGLFSRRARTNSKKRSPNRPPNQVGNQQANSKKRSPNRPPIQVGIKQANLKNTFRNMENRHTVLRAQYESLEQDLHNRDQLWRQHHEADQSRIQELESFSAQLSNQFRILEMNNTELKRQLKDQFFTHDRRYKTLEINNRELKDQLEIKKQIITKLTSNINEMRQEINKMRQERNNFARQARNNFARQARNNFARQARGPASRGQASRGPASRPSQGPASRPSQGPASRGQASRGPASRGPAFTVPPPQNSWDTLKKQILQRLGLSEFDKFDQTREEAWKKIKQLSPEGQNKLINYILGIFTGDLKKLKQTRREFILKYHPNKRKNNTNSISDDDYKAFESTVGILRTENT
jgi:hypothetical protein